MTRALVVRVGTAGIVLAFALSFGLATPATGGRDAGARPSQGPPGVVVALRDLTPPSQHVRFQTARVVALREDGQTVPLSLVAPGRAEGGSPEESLWVEGEAPPGSYTGLEVTFRSAERSGPDHAGALELSSAPTRVAAPFVVTAGSGTILAVTMRSSLAAGSPGRFEPVLEGRVRPRPTTGLMGLASVAGWDSVALFDKRSGALSSLIPVGRGPSGIAIDVERARAYVTISGEDVVASLDLLEGRVRERVVLRAGDAPRDLVLTPDGRTLVVANPGSDTVSFVDSLSATELERVPVAGRPASLLMDRDGRRVFVLAERSGSISVLSIPSRSPIGAIAVDSGPVRARLSGRGGERILVAQAESPYLAVIDSRTLALEQRVYVGPGARALEVDSRSGRIFLARAGAGRVEVFDPSSFLPLEEIPVPGEVAWLTVEAEGNGLGILLRDPAQSRIVSLLGGETLNRTPLGSDPAVLRFVQGRSAP